MSTTTPRPPHQPSPPVGWHVGPGSSECFSVCGCPEPARSLPHGPCFWGVLPLTQARPHCLASFPSGFGMEGEGQRDSEGTGPGSQHSPLQTPGALQTLAGLKGTTEVSEMFLTPKHHGSTLSQHGSCLDVASITQWERRKPGFLCFLHGQELRQKSNVGKSLPLVP